MTLFPVPWLQRMIVFLFVAVVFTFLFPSLRAVKNWNSELKQTTTSTSTNWLHQTEGLKPRPNDRNMPTQHTATLLGATCCVRLATVLLCVATCWVLLAQIWPVSNLSQQHPTCRNTVTSQHGGQTHATCCAQQCCDMLRWHVAIVWPGLNDQNDSYARAL